MNDFSERTLDSICEVVDCEHKTAPTQDQGYPSIRTTNIGRGRLELSGVNRVSEEVYRDWTRRAVPQADDLILAREAPVGNVAIIPTGMHPCLGQRTVLLRPDRKQVNPRYLCYLLLGEAIQNRFAALSSGATVPHLNVGDIRKLVLPELPSRSEQDSIAEILSCYDELLANNQRRSEILALIARAVYREWFVDLRYPGHESVELLDTNLGAIPQGWEWVTLDEVATVNRENIQSGEEPEVIHYIDISSVSPGSIDDTTAMPFAEAPSRARRLVRDGDIIWSTVRPNRRSYSLVLDPAPDTIASTGFAVLSAKSVPWSYLYGAVTTEEFVGHLVGRARGSAYPAVNVSDVKEAPILRPPRTLLDQFQNLTEPLHRLQRTLQRSNHVLTTTRDLLLPKLISGELDVSGLDIDTDAVAA